MRELKLDDLYYFDLAEDDLDDYDMWYEALGFSENMQFVEEDEYEVYDGDLLPEDEEELQRRSWAREVQETSSGDITHYLDRLGISGEEFQPSTPRPPELNQPISDLDNYFPDEEEEEASDEQMSAWLDEMAAAAPGLSDELLDEGDEEPSQYESFLSRSGGDVKAIEDLIGLSGEEAVEYINELDPGELNALYDMAGLGGSEQIEFTPEELVEAGKDVRGSYKDIPSAIEKGVDLETDVYRQTGSMTEDDFLPDENTEIEAHNLYRAGDNEVRGSVEGFSYGSAQDILDDFDLTNLTQILQALGKDSDVLTGSMMDVSFSVNGDYTLGDLKPIPGLSEKEVARRVITAAKHSMMEMLDNAPDGSILTASPVTYDERGDSRIKLYKRAGFGDMAGDQMRAVKIDGKIYPINDTVKFQEGESMSYFDLAEDDLDDFALWAEAFHLTPAM